MSNKRIYLAVEVNVREGLDELYDEWFELLDDLMEGSLYSIEPVDLPFQEGKQGGTSMIYQIFLSKPQTYDEFVQGMDYILSNVQADYYVLSIYYYLASSI